MILTFREMELQFVEARGNFFFFFVCYNTREGKIIMGNTRQIYRQEVSIEAIASGVCV